MATATALAAPAAAPQGAAPQGSMYAVARAACLAQSSQLLYQSNIIEKMGQTAQAQDGNMQEIVAASKQSANMADMLHIIQGVTLIATIILLPITIILTVVTLPFTFGLAAIPAALLLAAEAATAVVDVASGLIAVGTGLSTAIVQVVSGATKQLSQIEQGINDALSRQMGGLTGGLKSNIASQNSLGEGLNTLIQSTLAAATAYKGSR